MTEPDRLKATPEPLPAASEADLAEQMQTAISNPDDEPAEPSPQVPLEADPADALEQQQSVADAGPDDYR